jgi:hypothetical protein
MYLEREVIHHGPEIALLRDLYLREGKKGRPQHVSGQ